MCFCAFVECNFDIYFTFFSVFGLLQLWREIFSSLAAKFFALFERKLLTWVKFGKQDIYLSSAWHFYFKMSYKCFTHQELFLALSHLYVQHNAETSSFPHIVSKIVISWRFFTKNLIYSSFKLRIWILFPLLSAVLSDMRSPKPPPNCTSLSY